MAKKQKLNWDQLDLFAELDAEPPNSGELDPTQSEEEKYGGESLYPDSSELSSGQPEAVSDLDARREIGSSPTPSGTDIGAGGLGDAKDSGSGDRQAWESDRTEGRRDRTGQAPSDQQHGETDGRGEGSSRRSVRDDLEEDQPRDVALDQPNRFSPPLNVLNPQGARARAEANLAAIKVLEDLSHSDGQSTAATSSQQMILACYSGWGACQEIFDEANSSFSELRAELRDLLDEHQYAEARHSTLNAHYTDPVIADAMMMALEKLGLPEGAAVLEPGCGIGNFIGRRDGYGFVGVELDSTSARIAQHLYPDAEIMNIDFARKKGGGFDAAVGNVPFGDYTVADPVFNKAGHSIHNYFIIKSLRLTKPGGVAAFVTSAYTLNSQNPAARVEMARYGEFLGALRLPNSAHSRAAGTEVLTDIILFRRNDYVLTPEAAADQGWIKTQQIADTVRTNDWFVANPEMVLGKSEIVSGRFGPTLDVSLETNTDLAGLLAKRLDQVAVKALEAGNGFSADLAVLEEDSGTSRNHRLGSIYIDGEGRFFTMESTGRTALAVSGAAAAELHQLIKIRDAYDKLLEEEAKHFGDPEPQRSVLNEVYDAYVSKHGPINRFTLSQRRALDDDGVERSIKVYPKLGGFRKDKMFRAIAALESFDEGTGVATKAAVFRQAVLGEDSQILGTEDPAEAVAVSLSQKGAVDLDSVARLLGVSPAEAQEKIHDLVYTDPMTGSLTDAASYLSGNVRKKLAEANMAVVGGRNDLGRNVEALKEIIPKDLDIIEIKLRLGASWIEPEVVEQAFNSICSKNSWDKTRISYAEALGTWMVTGPGNYNKSVTITNEYGVPGHMDATKILDNLLNNREIQVRINTGDKMVVDPDLTAQARDKAELLHEKMLAAIVSDPTLSEQVAKEYNQRFNSIVPRSYNGDHLQLNGISLGFDPYGHQRQMVARILHSSTSLAAHPVGAGKTAEMVIAGQILRRTGKIAKPLYAVPNHMLEQFSREYIQLYPSAKILVADKDEVSPASRAEFVSRCASEFWDAVVMSHSSFGRIPLSTETEREFLFERRIELEAALAGLSGDNKVTVKSMEKKITRDLAKLEAKILAISRDDAYTFEQMGVDYIFVDEAHLFKNLATISSSSELAITGSQRATDLEMKLYWLRKSKEGQTAPRLATFATATPVANSPTEAYVMMRYLARDILENAKIRSFDDFAATFTGKVSTMELSPAGTEYRMKERIARYANLPELHAMLGDFMDYIPQEQLKIPLPKVKGEGIITINIPPDESLRRYTLTLGERAKMVQSGSVPPEVDNFLKITSDGRKAALDLRLVGRRYEDPENSKAKRVAQEIFDRHVASKNNVYFDANREAHPRLGALQLVFCDQSTPSERWNVYEQLRRELVKLGMDPNSIRFIHEAKTGAERDRLFEAARTGMVNVLVGSTSKMGTGVNVQDRAIAVHHLDAPWRPDELTQRIGRVVRQKNQNKEVEVLVYVNEGSFDVFSWQTLARKKSFIDQVLSSTVRELEDESEDAISYAQVKALATGNPLHIRKAELDSRILKLERRERAFAANLARGRNGIIRATDQMEKLEVRLAARKKLVESWDSFNVSHAAETDELLQSKHTYDATITGGWDREHAKQLDSLTGTAGEVDKFVCEVLKTNRYSTMPLEIDLNGLVVGAKRTPGDGGYGYQNPQWLFCMTSTDVELGANLSGSEFKVEDRSVYEGNVHLTQRIINQAKLSRQLVSATERDIEKTEQELAYFNEVVADGAFPEKEALESLRLERAEIEEALKASAEKEEDLIKEALSDEDRYVISDEEDLQCSADLDLEPHADLDPNESEEESADKSVKVAAAMELSAPMGPRLRL